MKWLFQKAAVAASAALIAGCPSDDGNGDAADETTSMTMTGMTDPATSGSPTTAATMTAGPTSATMTTVGTSSGTTDGTTGMAESSSGGADSSSGGGMTIPDPGNAPEDWTSEGDISTPGLAWPVGVATMGNPYIEGTSGDEGNAFFVFEAGPAFTTLDIGVFGPVVPNFIHLHDGTGLVFGPEVAADTHTPPTASFTVTPGQIYVLEINFDDAQFF